MPTQFLTRLGQPRIAYEIFEPEKPARATIFATPGFSEHRGRYEHVYPAWVDADFRVVGYDLRGQGESEGRRGHVDRFEDFVGDASALIDLVRSRVDQSKRTPWLLFGHSLGALINAHLDLAGKHSFRGTAWSSPFFGLSLPAAWWQRGLAIIATHLSPGFSQPTDIGGGLLTRDAERARQIDEDPHRVRRVTARWFTETQKAQRTLLARCKELRTPVFCLAAEVDHIASIQTTRNILNRLTCETELQTLAGCYHELHQELERQEHIGRFTQQFLSWTN